MSGLLSSIKLFVIKRRYRLHNSNNETFLVRSVPLDCVSVGRNTYGPINVYYMQKGSVKIGNYVSIGPDVKLLLGGQHNYKGITTYPFKSKVYNKSCHANSVEAKITIEDDVWIGYGALIMSDVCIGKGAVIAANAIVTKDVPPYHIVIGNKIVKQRFSDELIAKLKDVDFSKISHHTGDSFEQYCAVELNSSNVDDIIRAFKNCN